jgi:predicted AAA+ superfamily ATPase
MEFHRHLQTQIESKLFKKKAIILVGPRQVGKTTLLRKILSGSEYLFLDGDDGSLREQLANASSGTLRRIIGKHKIVFIDELQRIPNIGLTMKIITDQFPEVQLIASGSSALEIHQSIQEPLTGRKWEYFLYPISWQEFAEELGPIESNAQLEHRIVYGMYPDVILSGSEEREVIELLTQSYLFKDVLAYTGVRKPDILNKLLQALALQIGSEVSYNELSKLLGIDKNTVNKYIDILEKSFIIFQLSSFSRNLRNEIKNSRKIYFYDTGIRNAIINNFNMLDLRADKGALWENFLISERKKYNSYHKQYCNQYFWRTTSQKEIDLIEEKNGEIWAYEFKWDTKEKLKIKKDFEEGYSTKAVLIDRSNYQDFLLPQT